jgi:hypothetical protein
MQITIHFTQEDSEDPEKGQQLATKFEEGLLTWGISQGTVFLIREYAHLLAFYLEQAESAIQVTQ